LTASSPFNKTNAFSEPVDFFFFAIGRVGDDRLERRFRGVVRHVERVVRNARHRDDRRERGHRRRVANVANGRVVNGRVVFAVFETALYPTTPPAGKNAGAV
jgi:hypothetical protein